MYNSQIPEKADLPTSEQLKKSTLIALLSAAIILVTIVLPSEYAIDPTRIGRLLGLTEMGEIKNQLAEEAAADALAQSGNQTPSSESIAAQLNRIESLLASNNGQATPALAPVNTAQIAAPIVTSAPAEQERIDRMTFELAPGQGIEIKMVMKAGDQAAYSWSSQGGPINYDTHGDAKGKSVSYDKGRGVESDQGTITAAFDGNHGWFWRNRNQTSIMVTLNTKGKYLEIKRVI